MKKRIKILCLATVLVFALAGVSFADLITYDYINKYSVGTENEEVGARVYLEVTFADGLYTYTYQIENVLFDPLGDGVSSPLLQFLLPIALPLSPTDDAPLGYSDLPGTGVVSVGLDQGSLGGVNMLVVDFLGVGLWPFPGVNLSDKFYIVSEFSPKLGDAVLKDQESDIICVLSNLYVPGGGNDTNPVPEPATLLLLGMGALGLEGFRRLKSRRA